MAVELSSDNWQTAIFVPFANNTDKEMSAISVNITGKNKWKTYNK